MKKLNPRSVKAIMEAPREYGDYYDPDEEMFAWEAAVASEAKAAAERVTKRAKTAREARHTYKERSSRP